MENNNTSTKHPTKENGQVVRKSLERQNFVEGPKFTNLNHVSQNNDEEDDRTSNFFRREMNNSQAVILKKTLPRWPLMKKKSSKHQVPVLKAYELYTQSAKVLPRIAIPKTTEEGLVDKSSTIQVQIPIKRDDNVLTPAYFVPRPWWMQSPIEISSTAIENVQLTTESIKLKKENEKQAITFNRFDANEDDNQWITVSEERKQFKPIPIPEPWVKQYMISDMTFPNSERENQQLPLSTQRTQTLEPEQVFTQSTAPEQSDFHNWALLLFDSKVNKKFEEEHKQLENEHQRNRNQRETASQILIESAEVDDDRNMALRKKAETWYSNLQSRRSLPNWRHLREMGKIMRFRRGLQSALAALSQRRLLPEWRSHAVDYRRLNRWRRQLLNRFSMPQAVDYRRLLSLWRKKLRRQLQIKWNRRPLVEVCCFLRSKKNEHSCLHLFNN